MLFRRKLELLSAGLLTPNFSKINQPPYSKKYTFFPNLIFKLTKLFAVEIPFCCVSVTKQKIVMYPVMCSSMRANFDLDLQL